MMERTQIFDLMGELKLYGMKRDDEVMTTGIKRQHEPPQIVRPYLLNAEVAENRRAPSNIR